MLSATVNMPVVMTETIMVTAANEKLAKEKAEAIFRLRDRYNVHHFDTIAFKCYAQKEEE